MLHVYDFWSWFSFSWEGFACKRLCQIHLRCDFFSFYDHFVLGFFFTGAGMDIIFKDLEAETIHVCIAWALLNILGCFLLRLVTFTVYFLFSIPLFTDCFSLYIGFGDWWTTRYLATGTWLVGLGCERNHGMRSCFCLKSISLGVSRVCEFRPFMHLKWLFSLSTYYLPLSPFYLFSFSSLLFIFIALIFWDSQRAMIALYDVDYLD